MLHWFISFCVFKSAFFLHFWSVQLFSSWVFCCCCSPHFLCLRLLNCFLCSCICSPGLFFTFILYVLSWIFDGKKSPHGDGFTLLRTYIANDTIYDFMLWVRHISHVEIWTLFQHYIVGPLSPWAPLLHRPQDNIYCFYAPDHSP